MIIAVIEVAVILIWQANTSGGNPDPAATNIGKPTAILETGVLVFREGLESILVLAAITIGLIRSKKPFWKPIVLGAGIGVLLSFVTWFIATGIISRLPFSDLDIQAGTGLLAIVVLLIVMNWFLHDVYWNKWIYTKAVAQRKLINNQDTETIGTFAGLAFLGFSSVYREGFELVVFLQSLRLKAGDDVIQQGFFIGIALTLIVGWMTFVLQKRLPYMKMLVITGIMLGAVLLVMVGESIQELQLAHWISTTELPLPIPDWMGIWFALFPNVEGIAAQLLSAIIVIGSYYAARYIAKRRNVAKIKGV